MIFNNDDIWKVPIMSVLCHGFNLLDEKFGRVHVSPIQQLIQQERG